MLPDKLKKKYKEVNIDWWLIKYTYRVIWGLSEEDFELGTFKEYYNYIKIYKKINEVKNG